MTLHTLVSAAELAARIESSAVLVVDCRKDLGDADSGERAYAAGHVVNAVYADLDTDLSDLGKRGLGRHPLPDAAAFSRTLSRWGWHPDLPVVAYDDAGGALAAARLWWMLRLVGSNEVAVLDGGIRAWRGQGLAETTTTMLRPPGNVSVQFDAAALPDYAAIAQGLEEESIVLIDARAAPRFRGETEPLDAAAGHVPGARNRPFSANLDGDGRFKSARQLHEEFIALIGDHAPSHVVHMCGSGVTACHNLLAMEHSGLSGSRVFAPSWSGWIDDPARPRALAGAHE